MFITLVAKNHPRKFTFSLDSYILNRKTEMSSSMFLSGLGSVTWGLNTNSSSILKEKIQSTIDQTTDFHVPANPDHGSWKKFSCKSNPHKQQQPEFHTRFQLWYTRQEINTLFYLNTVFYQGPRTQFINNFSMLLICITIFLNGNF